ncbi:MAG TPA: hypothetical protein VG942_00865 [Hyphomonadaceae bacterium]|nr:hypothetical protein [Hyphomonadaceae bacterium]
MTRIRIAAMAVACLAPALLLLACNKAPEPSAPATPAAPATTPSAPLAAPTEPAPASPAPAPDAKAEAEHKKQIDDLVKAGQEAAKADEAAGLQPYSLAIKQYNPKTQHFIWVLPEGVHGLKPWNMQVVIKEKGEVKYDSAFPLKDEVVPASNFPELPPKSEVVRLSDDGSWDAHMAEVNKKIDDLVAQYGHGNGELLMQSELHTRIDDAHRKMYCQDGVKPKVRFYLEDASTKKLTQFSFGPLGPLFEQAILKGCKT